jgi:ribosomal protein S12 methylthiotransferase accessory factor
VTAWHASAYTGLFRRFGSPPVRPHDPALFLCSGLPAAWSPLADAHEAGGIGLDAAAAEAACIGEAIERLQSYPLPDDEIVVASHDAWPRDEPAVTPDSWVLFHPEQYALAGFPFRPLTPTTVCPWVRCRHAITGLALWAPAECVYLNLCDRHSICPGISTGLACGRVGDPLLWRGLQEVIERDAVVGAWWHRYVLHQYPAADVFAELGPDIRHRLLRPNLRYRCYRVASPFSDHVTMVTLEGEDHEGPCFSVGSACRGNRRASWTKAALEAVHGRHYVRHLRTQATATPNTPATFAEHALYYSLHPDELPHTAFNRAKAPPPEAAPASEPLGVLLDRLGPRHPALFRSMTPPAIAAESLGWHVLRVVVPGLQPLHGNHALPHLGGALWSPRGLAEWATVPPHPFP